MSRDAGIAGWDLGGAHLKFASVDCTGGLRQVTQLPTPLWQGLDKLDEALQVLARQWPLERYRHVLTMTGELVDVFDTRADGVAALTQRVVDHLGQVELYAGPHGFVDPGAAVARAGVIASANWYATLAWLARQVPHGLLVDIGSTTSDILAFHGGLANNRGYSDRERLACDELVYSGVVRTPVMAVAQRLPLGGDWVQVANEHFATMADVYRVLGWLPSGCDQHPTADGRGKSVTASMRRLARMLGSDLDDADADDWTNLAAYVADRQLDTLAQACHRQLSRGLPAGTPLVGAGSGRFLVERLAARLDRPYLDIETCLPVPDFGGLSAAVCAPAVAVALLAHREDIACAC